MLTNALVIFQQSNNDGRRWVGLGVSKFRIKKKEAANKEKREKLETKKANE